MHWFFMVFTDSAFTNYGGKFDSVWFRRSINLLKFCLKPVCKVALLGVVYLGNYESDGAWKGLDLVNGVPMAAFQRLALYSELWWFPWETSKQEARRVAIVEKSCGWLFPGNVLTTWNSVKNRSSRIFMHIQTVRLNDKIPLAQRGGLCCLTVIPIIRGFSLHPKQVDLDPVYISYSCNWCLNRASPPKISASVSNVATGENEIPLVSSKWNLVCLIHVPKFRHLGILYVSKLARLDPTCRKITNCSPHFLPGR